jgi:ECF sigma factor
MGDEPPAAEQITAWLTDWREGDQQAPERLFAVLYPELRRIAARLLRKERNDHTLEPSGLVDELCIRLLGSAPVDYQDRAPLFRGRRPGDAPHSDRLRPRPCCR